MVNGKLFYKCRRCGGILKSSYVKDVGSALRADFNKIKRSFPMWKIHYCDDHGVGIADLIGANPEANPQKENTTIVEQEKNNEEDKNLE